MTLRYRNLDEVPRHLRSPDTCSVPDRKVTNRKYRNEPVQVDGITFDSKLEARCFEELKLRQAAGEVAWFLCQVAFPLEGGVVYRCDFLVKLTAGGTEIIDAKGKDTQASINKRKQVKARYGEDVILWRG